MIKINKKKLKFVFTKYPEIFAFQIFLANQLKSKDDVYHFVKYNKSFSKIKSSNALLILYTKADSETKEMIKKSKYWKDDAKLILEVVNG